MPFDKGASEAPRFGVVSEVRRVNNLGPLFSLACVVVSILASRFLTLRIIDRLNRQAEQTAHFFTTPVGSAVLFAAVFVVVWCAVSFVAALPWLLFHLW